MKATFFTTLTEAYWHEIGRYCLPSWKVLGNVVVFLDKREGGDLDKFLATTDWKVHQISDCAIKFHKELPAHIREKSHPVGGGYNHRFDIGKFSWPAFVFAQALRELRGPLIWLDADVVVRTFNDDFFQTVFPGDSEATYLGRTHHPPDCPYTETGLLGFRMDHKKAKILADEIERIILSGEVYNFRQWHDCTVYDAAVKKLSDQIKFKSISRNDRIDPVFLDTLGKWMIHYWGKRQKSEVRR